MAIGDSKTIGYPDSLATNGYRDLLVENMAEPPTSVLVDFIGSHAVDALTMAQAAAQLPAFVAAHSVAPDWILFSVGSADIAGVNGPVTEAAWTANLGSALDTLHAAYPTAQIRVMRPLFINYSANSDVMNDDWIPPVLASRAAWAAVGPDERTFLDETTMADGLHPTPAGYALTAAEWQTAIGY